VDTSPWGRTHDPEEARQEAREEGRRADKYMTFGLTNKANLTREEGASHQLLGSAWFFTALDDATEAKLSAIVRKATS